MDREITEDESLSAFVKEGIAAGESQEALQAYEELMGESVTLSDFDENFMGHYSSDEEFVQDLLQETEEGLSQIPEYIHIDWEKTARDIMIDYQEQDGFYFKS